MRRFSGRSLEKSCVCGYAVPRIGPRWSWKNLNQLFLEGRSSKYAVYSLFCTDKAIVAAFKLDGSMTAIVGIAMVVIGKCCCSGA